VERHKFVELLGRPERGRVFRQARRPVLADCAPSGRVRLDALARWAQDIAYADAEDAGLSDSAVWVIRRTRMHVGRFPRFGEQFELATFCSGLGRMWAERRTSMTRAGEETGAGEVELATLWVHIDPRDGRPFPLTADELATWGETAGGRHVAARLHHPAPDGVEYGIPWWFRATELDLAGHINNAAYLQPLEEELLRDGDPGSIDLEIEYRSPAQPGEQRVLRNGARRWIVSARGETHASILLGAEPAVPPDPSPAPPDPSPAPPDPSPAPPDPSQEI
jgi:acyl-ACP thioesterase